MKRFALCVLTGTAVACNSDVAGVASTSNPALANLSALHVGEVRAMTFADAQDGIVIPASASPAQYLIVAANLNTAENSVSQYTVTGDRVSPHVLQTRGAVEPPVSDSGVLMPHFTAIGGSYGTVFEGKLRHYERSYLAPLLASANASLLVRHSLLPPSLLPPLRTSLNVPAVGDTMTIKTLSDSAFEGGIGICDHPVTTVGTVQSVSQHAIVVRDNRLQNVSGGFTRTDYDSIAHEFDQTIYPTDVSYFGTPTDLDQNGGRIILYYTPSVNVLTPPGDASNGYVGGFFFAGDLFPPSTCAVSNQREIFYLLAPDPDSVYHNVFETADVRMITRGTVSHEFQHMINAGHRVTNPAASAIGFEATWLDEGLAHTAEDAVGRVEFHLGELALVSNTTVNRMPPDIYNAFFAQNFGRLKPYVERPDTTGPIVGQRQAQNNLASRGAVWSMLRYAADWFSGGAPETLTRALAAGPDTGTTNLVHGVGVPLDTLLGRWLVTLYADHNGTIPNLDPRYNYKSYTLRNILMRILSINNGNAYLMVRSIGSSPAAMTVDIASSSGTYFLIDAATGVDRNIRIVANGSISPPDKYGRLYVLRVK